MRIGFATIVTTLAAIPMVAYADPTARMTDTQFLRASRCAALATAPQIKADGADMAWLADEVKSQSHGRAPYIRDKARDEARNIERSAKRADSEAELAELKAERAEACAGFDSPSQI